MITLSEVQIGRLLIDRRVEISVGEPWDFESPDGQGTLKGSIEKVVEGGDETRAQSIEIGVTPFIDPGGHRITRLVARRRYKDPTGIIEQVASGETAPANFDYSDQVPEEEREVECYPGLIGGLRLAD